MIRNNQYNMKKKIIFCPSIEIGGVEKIYIKSSIFFADRNLDLYLVTLSKNLGKKGEIKL